MRGAPHRGFSCDIFPINSRISLSIFGRPTGAFDFHRQYKRRILLVEQQVSLPLFLISDRNRHTSDFHVAPSRFAEASLLFVNLQNPSTLERSTMPFANSTIRLTSERRIRRNSGSSAFTNTLLKKSVINGSA